MLDVSEESVSVDDNDDEVALLRFRFRDMGAARGEGVLCSFSRQQLSEGVLCSEPLSCLGGFISSIHTRSPSLITPISEASRS